MEVLPKDELFDFHSDTLEVIRKTYDLDKPGAMRDAVQILDEWIRKQNHFTVKEFDKGYLERMIIASKGSIERTKSRLDKLFTLRSLMPKFFKDYDIRHDFDSLQDIITCVILPKPTKEYDRVIFCKVVGKKFSANLYLTGYSFTFLLSEYMRVHDYAKSYYFVIDYLNVGIAELLAAVDLVDLRQAVVAQIEGYGLRMKGVHILVNSTMVDVLVSIAKQVVTGKVKERIHTHKTYEDLYKYVPREIFPKEFGGDEKPLKEIHAAWMAKLTVDEFQEYWKKMNSARTDETFRQTDNFNDQYIGMPGTFRTLSVD